jgi:hypothetical protein
MQVSNSNHTAGRGDVRWRRVKLQLGLTTNILLFTNRQGSSLETRPPTAQSAGDQGSRAGRASLRRRPPAARLRGGSPSAPRLGAGQATHQVHQWRNAWPRHSRAAATATHASAATQATQRAPTSDHSSRDAHTGTGRRNTLQELEQALGKRALDTQSQWRRRQIDCTRHKVRHPNSDQSTTCSDASATRRIASSPPPGWCSVTSRSVATCGRRMAATHSSTGRGPSSELWATDTDRTWVASCGSSVGGGSAATWTGACKGSEHSCESETTAQVANAPPAWNH